MINKSYLRYAKLEKSPNKPKICIFSTHLNVAYYIIDILYSFNRLCLGHEWPNPISARGNNSLLACLHAESVATFPNITRAARGPWHTLICLDEVNNSAVTEWYQDLRSLQALMTAFADWCSAKQFTGSLHNFYQ